MQFDKINKKIWLNKLLLDLKAKDASSLDWQIGENTSFPAMFHEDDAVESGILHNTSGHPVLIAQDFLIEDTQINNVQILKALSHGLNAPKFIFENEKCDFYTLFDGVHLEMISPSYHFLFLACAKSFKQYLEKEYQNLHVLNGSIGSNSIPLDQIQELFNNYAFNCKCFHLDNSSKDLTDIPNALKNLCTKVIEYLAGANRDIKDQSAFIIEVGIGHSFLIEIAKLRAIRVLLANIFKAFNLSESTAVQIHVYFHSYHAEMISSDRMIAASTQSICAYLGNADRINVQAASSDPFHEHVARNVMHVLQQESHLDFVKDPTAGSYYIEELTNQLCDKTWKLIQEE